MENLAKTIRQTLTGSLILIPTVENVQWQRRVQSRHGDGHNLPREPEMPVPGRHVVPVVERRVPPVEQRPQDGDGPVRERRTAHGLLPLDGTTCPCAREREDSIAGTRRGARNAAAIFEFFSCRFK